MSCDRLSRYHKSFFDDVHRREYILENTTGDAAKLLRSYILDPPKDWTPNDFVEFVANAFTDPAKRENATAEFGKLLMRPQQHFWEFWQKFRALSTETEYRDDRFLREQLRAKFLVRLSNTVQTEWKKCNTLSDYVDVLQDANAHFHSTQHR